MLLPKEFPIEFREDVIRVLKESDACIAEIAKDFGISPSCLKRWLTMNERKSAGAANSAHAGGEDEALRQANSG